MGVECPKCHSENADTARFCSNCATPLPPSEEIPASPTKTLETPTEELTRGTTFAGRYEIIEELGKGGMGKVYRVEDKKIKEEVALKLIKPEVASDRKTIERFRSELKIARKIRHKNVCGMYDLDEEKGTHYITMEYVRGEDLKKLIRKIGQLSAGQAIPIAIQVCDGLSEAHRLGVVHRDLKPHNVMVDEGGNARIMDFGIARSLESKGITGAGVMVGTPEYMSPEQVEGKEAGQSSDIYSLGVILYEMVTGRVPFEGDTPFTIGVKHKSEMPKDPKELNTQIPEDLSSVIMRCLEKDKEKRYQSASEVRSELEKIQKGIPTTERVIPKRKPSTSKEITVTFNLKKLLIPALAVVALIVAVVIILQLLPQKEAFLGPKIENSIAVISFENQTGDISYDYLQKAIPNLLITSLEQTGDLYVVTWERMRDILGQIGKKDVETIDRDMGFRLCRREGVEVIVLGSFIKAENIFATDVKVLDVETKRLLKSASSRGEGVDSILVTQIDELSREIFQGIGIARQKIEAVKLRIADVATTSMEAYNSFLKGREEYDKGYNNDARRHLEKAVELDPEFAVAYLYLAYTHGRLRNIQARNEAYEKAKLYSVRASDKERLFIEASYANAVEKDPEKRFRIYEELTRKYPQEKRVHVDLANYYRRKNLYRQAIEEFNKALKLDPNFGIAMNSLAYTYANMGDFEKAIESFKRYASLSPGDADPFDSMAELYFKMGRLEEAIAKYKQALEIKPDFGAEREICIIYAVKGDYSETMKWVDQFIAVAPSPGLRAQGYLGRAFSRGFLGQVDQAIKDLQKAEEIWQEDGNLYGISVLNITKGMIYYDIGEFKLSREYYKKYSDIIFEYQPQFLQRNKVDSFLIYGLIDTKEGKLASAKLKLEEGKSLLPESSKEDPGWAAMQRFTCDLLHAEILLKEGSVEKAIEVMENAFPLEVPPMSPPSILRLNTPLNQDVLARAYQKKGELDKAIAVYEDLINFNPDSKDRRVVHPKYHYNVAKLYEEKGWEGKAIDHYEKFLDLWKDADPALPEVEYAKKRLARLKSQIS